MKRVLITGASGFIGREISRQMLERKYKLSTIRKSIDKEFQNSNCKSILGDLWSKDTLQLGLKKADVIIHCAGNPSFQSKKNQFSDNLELTRYIIQNCKTLRKPKSFLFVYISSIGVADRKYSDSCEHPLTELTCEYPSSNYGKSKLAAEKSIISSGFNYVILRPSLVVGPEMRFNSHFSVFAGMALRETPFSMFNWPGEFSVLHVSDLAKAVITVVETPKAKNQIFYCSGSKVQLGEFLRKCNSNVAKINLRYAYAFLKRFPYLATFKLKALFLPALVADDSKLKELGWRPGNHSNNLFEDIISRETSRIFPQKNKSGTAVISGAASGLGASVVSKLLKYKKKIILLDIKKTKLKFPKDVKVIEVKIDLSDILQVKKFLNSNLWISLTVDDLYLCAGVGYKGPFHEINFKKINEIIFVNFVSRVYFLRSVISKMKKRGFGRIVLISSSSAFHALPGMALYSSVSAALLSFGKSLWYECKAHGIEVLTVCPSGMQTNFQKNAGVKLLKGEALLNPSSVAQKILFCISNNNKPKLILGAKTFFLKAICQLIPDKLECRLIDYLFKTAR